MNRRLIEALARPPRILSILSVLWLAVIVIASSDTGTGLPTFFGFVFGALGLGVSWAARFWAFLVARRLVAPSRPATPASWIVVPICVQAAIVLNFIGQPPHNPLFQLRFNLSEAALTRHAEALVADASHQSLEPRRIGLFLVARVEARDRQVRFITTSCGVVDSCGLVYSPDAEPRRWQEDRFRHLRGPWWHVYEGF
jgi:hypothetical protein